MSADSTIIQTILDDKVKFIFNEDDLNDVYAEFEADDGITHTEPLNSPLFQSFLRREYRKQSDGEICSNFDEFLQAALDDAYWDNKIKLSICHRVDGSFIAKRIVYSLANESQEAVIVFPESEKGNWKIVSEYKLKKRRFLKSNSSESQVTPVSGGNYLALLKQYVNLSKDSFLLFAVWLIQCLSKASSHLALLISGSQGTGKSTLTELIQRLIDPAKTSKAILPKTDKDLKVLLYNSYLLCFDNTRALSDRISDILCSAISGTTASFRKLYTTSEQVDLKLHNIIVLNGIDIVPKQSDLAERCLLMEPNKINPKSRKPESQYWAAFEKDRPAIVGAMFDTLSKAMRLYSNLQFEELHRMADAEMEMTAIAVALGVEQAEFKRIFDENVKRLNLINRSENPFFEALIDYLQHRPKETTTTVTGLLDAMKKDFTNRSRISYLNSLPKSPSALSRFLKNADGPLSDAGYKLDITVKSDASYVTIKMIPQSKLTKSQKERRAKLLSNNDTTEE